MNHNKNVFRTIAPFLMVLILVLAGWAAVPGLAQQGGQLRYYLPVIRNNTSLPPADAASARLTVPAGFAIRIFAQGLVTPRLMALGPDGWIYAASSKNGVIYRLPDQNRDGLVDKVETAVSGLTAPNNVEFYNGWMYVAESSTADNINGKVERFADQNHDGIYETRQVVTDNLPGKLGHNSRTVHFGPDGKMYVSIGSTCNICVETDPRRAAILRFNADGTIPTDNPFANDPNQQKRPVWAWGLRNSVDFLWTPGGQMWADHMGSDNISDVLPPEEIIIPVQGNRFFGWPYCYTPGVGLNIPTQPEVSDVRMTPPAGVTCAQAVPAILTAPAHSAPLGMSMEKGSNFPIAYKNNIFVAFHGSWNTNDPASYRDCKVERVIVQNGQVTGSETFVNGFRAPGAKCGDPSRFGRPAGTTFGSDGALYISDDASGRIYRVVYVGK